MATNCRAFFLIVVSIAFLSACESDNSSLPPFLKVLGEQYLPSQHYKKAVSSLNESSYSGRIIIKFKEGTRVRFNEKGFTSLSGFDMDPVRKILSSVVFEKITRLSSEDPERVEEERDELQKKTKVALKDLNLYFAVSVPSVAVARQLLDRLNKLDVVEIAYPESKRIPAIIDNFEPLQGYLDPASKGGIDARYAWLFAGGKGEGVTIYDLDIMQPNFSHEDLPLSSKNIACGTLVDSDPKDEGHATAVIGEMVAVDNGFGVTGICPSADIMVEADDCIGGGVEGGVALATKLLKPGDIILIEYHIGGPPGTGPCDSTGIDGCVPAEWDHFTYASIQKATAKGITVVEPSGNGNNDLDDPVYGGVFNPNGAPTFSAPSGAIMVGAGDPLTHKRAWWFSNYGNRVNLQGWGYGVMTTGGGDKKGSGQSPDQWYTDNFGGTSSAAPMVAGAFAIMRGISTATGAPLSGEKIFEVLKETGTPQPEDDAGHIGPLPNLKAAICSLFNKVPIANAGPNQTTIAGDKITLYGSGSDSDGSSVTYTWQQIGGPEVSPNSLHIPSPSFFTEFSCSDSTLVFSLVVTDECGASSAESITKIMVSADNVSDSDEDGLLDCTEISLGTDMNNSDTDADGLSDGAEVNTYQTNPKLFDTDGDWLKDGAEVNPYKTNPKLADTDSDGLTDGDEVIYKGTNPLSPDTDSDGVGDKTDNCPLVANGDQKNSDGEGQGDACDADDDNDGVLDINDNCQTIPNSDQGNVDQDLWGDACDTDKDNDGLTNEEETVFGTDPTKKDSDADGTWDKTDNCPVMANSDQKNTDGDTQGDICDNDDDNDGVVDTGDNCPLVVNTDQKNTDGDSEGDTCDSDDDNDTVLDTTDNCPLIANTDQANNDQDSLGDLCDPDDDNDSLTDDEEKVLGTNPFKPDTDDDTIGDKTDNCPLLTNTDQKNTDGDSKGDVCDPDDDNDNVADGSDNCPLIANTDQANNDQDSEGDVCDLDDDNDGLIDQDESVWKTDPFNADTDGEGLTDGDEVHTHNTNPLVTDTDNDGLTDYEEVKVHGTKPLIPDSDSDGLTDGEEVKKYGTKPLDKDTDKDALLDGDEVKTTKTNPLVTDTDGDFIPDGAEVKEYQTDPLQADTDGDGLDDGLEVYLHKTDPLVVDTDTDELTDYDEVTKHKTNPLNPNTDTDCWPDGHEVKFASYGYHPKIKQGPIISVTPNSMDFGKVNRRGKLIYYELANTGNFNLVVQGKIKGAGFEMGSVPTQLAPGKKVQVPIAFHPVQAGPASGEATFQSNDCTQKVVKIPLKVEGLFANLKVDTQEINFGFVDRFTTEQKPVVISNPFSNETLRVAVTNSEVAFWPEEYLVEVPPLGTKELLVNFRPYRYGEVKGELTLKAFLANNTQEIKIPLLGFGSGPPPVLSPSDYILMFKNSTGSTSWKTLTVTNKGESDLYISEIRILDETGNQVPFTEGGANDFVFVPAYGNFYVPAGKKRDLPIRYEPKKDKKYQQTLVLTYNGMGSEGYSELEIKLIGE